MKDASEKAYKRIGSGLALVFVCFIVVSCSVGNSVQPAAAPISPTISSRDDAETTSRLPGEAPVVEVGRPVASPTANASAAPVPTSRIAASPAAATEAPGEAVPVIASGKELSDTGGVAKPESAPNQVSREPSTAPEQSTDGASAGNEDLPDASTALATTASWHQDAKVLASGRLESVEFRETDGALVLQAESHSGFRARGTVSSNQHETRVPFTEAIASWNADAPPGTAIRLEMRTMVEGEWTSWYGMGVWRGHRGASIAGQRDGFGRVDIDTLKLSRPATALQVRAILSTENPSLTPALTDLWVSYTDTTRPPSGPAIDLPDGWARDLAVPGQSQAVQDPAVAWVICSPTSLTMVLQYWGVDTTVPKVVAGVRDATAGIYGNWPLNTAYAATYGLRAYVDRFYSLEQLQAEIAEGRPVVASVRFSRGELSNYPNYGVPQGHLIVVRGFTPEGDVIVNDPAASSISLVRRVYKRDDFINVWLNRGGVVYRLSPRE